MREPTTKELTVSDRSQALTPSGEEGGVKAHIEAESSPEQAPTVDPSFRDYLRELDESEYRHLEADILERGCTTPLDVWKDHGILLDGHHRLRICTEHDIPFAVNEVALPDREAVIQWMIKAQLGRRNIGPDEFSYYLGQLYESEKRAEGRPDKRYQNDTVSGRTRERIAEEYGVSAPTVTRAAEYARAVDIKATAQQIPASAIIAERTPRKQVIKEAFRETKRAERTAALESTATQEKAIEGVYDVVVIDPPWKMRKIERDLRPNQVVFDYPAMTMDELTDLVIPCADDAHVWLWTTHKHLPAAFSLLGTWNLKYVCTFVWHKPGGFQPVGLPQYNCEFVLYARRGSPSFIETKALPTCFEGARGKHSEKPLDFYDMVRRVTAGRRIDMFGRRAIEGFDAWGKEAPGGE